MDHESLDRWLDDLGRRRVAIVTCMDTRIDSAGLFDDCPEPAYLIRNAGGRVSDDALRSLAVACTMGVEWVLVIYHTNCAMAENSEDEIRDLLPTTSSAADATDFLTIGDFHQTLREDVERIHACTMLPASIRVAGLVYDPERGQIQRVEVSAA